MSQAPLSGRKKLALEVLSKPKTPAEIRRQMGLKSGNNISSTLRELADLNLIYCLSPNARLGKLYGLTTKGKTQRKKLLKEQGITFSYVEPSSINWNLYGWVVCGKQRKVILKAMKMPLPMKEILTRAKEYNIRISRENAFDILWSFLRKGIAIRIRKRIRHSNTKFIFILTRLGEAIRYQLLEP